MSQEAPKELTEAQQVAEVQRWMSESKKALKGMSKNDLIRAVSALLLDKKILINQLNRLQGQNEVLNATNITDGSGTTLPAAASPE